MMMTYIVVLSEDRKELQQMLNVVVQYGRDFDVTFESGMSGRNSECRSHR